jgi:hypothetical protein
MTAASGVYQVLPLAAGYVSDMANILPADVSAGNATGLALTLTAGTYAHVLNAVDIATGSSLRGVQFFLQSSSSIVIVNTDNNGYAVAAATPAYDWGYDPSSQSLNGLGYVRPSNNNGGSNGTTLYAINSAVPYRAANALFYGTLTDNAGTPNPLVDFGMNANDQGNTFSVDTQTDATGHYYLPIYANGSTWFVGVDNKNPAFGVTYSVPSNQSTTPVASTAYQYNFVAPAVTATIAGTIKNADSANAPVNSVTVNLYSVVGQNTNYVASVTTGTDGVYSFGITAGAWAIALDTGSNNANSANAKNLVAPALSFPTIVDGNHLTGQDIFVKNGTGTISGTVSDFNATGISSANVQATASINSVTYVGSASTDNTGHYSFPTIAGTWTVNAYSNLSFTAQSPVATTGTTTVNFSPTVYFYSPSNQSNVMAGSQTQFSAGVNSSTGVTGLGYQWQVNSGSGWGNVPTGSPYSGETTTTLTINPVSLPLTNNQYRLVTSFTYNAVPGHTENSGAATLTVSGSAPLITSQPVDAHITASGGTTFTVGASGTPTPSSYQWQVSTDGGTIWNNLSDGAPYSGTQLASLNLNNVPTTLNGYKYHCIVGNGVAPDATSNAATLLVDAQTQTVNFTGGTYSLNQGISLNATATSGLGVTYAVNSNSATYTLVGTTLTLTSVGSVSVRASQSGNSYYSSAFTDATFTVDKLAASVTLTTTSANYDGTQKSAAATTNPASLTVLFTYDGSSTAPTAVGTYALVGTISDATYQGSASGTFTINKGNQSISFIPPSTVAFSALPLTLSASATSGLTVTFAATSGLGSITGGNQLTATGAGPVTVRASQAGNGSWNAASPVDQVITVTADYNAWAAANYNLPGEATQATPTYIYGQDGLTNLVKYTLGLAAKTNATSGLPTVTTNGTNWIYTITKPTAVTDVTVTVEFSTDLVTWNTTGVTQNPPVSNTGTDTIVATHAVSGTPNGFFRMRVVY